MLCTYTMNSINNFDSVRTGKSRGARSNSAQGLRTLANSSVMNIPLPPRLWLTDMEDDSSDGSDDSAKDDEVQTMDRPRVRSRFRHYKSHHVNIPIGIFWDIENCQVPRGCSAIDVVAAIRAKFLMGRREADFVVVCDVRKEAVNRLQELNDAQVNLIHVCGTQKNAADEKLRQCMRRFGELHSAPAALLLISGDINFAADLSDFRHRKNMDVILVHKQNTSSALIACASSHYCYNDLVAHLPRNPKTLSQTEEDEEPTCEMEVANLPMDQPPERVSRRLGRLADNCGGKVLRVTAPTATLRFPTPDHASRALKRMDGEDVFGRKISTRYARSAPQPPTYSSDEGYATASAAQPRLSYPPAQHQVSTVSPREAPVALERASSEWALALQQLPTPLAFCPPPAVRPRQIRGTHGSVSLDGSGCSSSNSGDDSRLLSQSRAGSPWNCSGSSETSAEESAELTVTNLPPVEPLVLQEMLTQLFSHHMPVVRVSVWPSADGPLASVVLRSEWDARLAIARIHKRRLDSQWASRRLELSLGRPSPAPNPDVLRARLKAILVDQENHCLPLLRLRDAYASRHGCALTTSDLARVRDTVLVHENYCRMVQLIDVTPASNAELEEPWKCHIHATLSTSEENGSLILQPVYMQVALLATNVYILLENHGGILPLLSFVECYEATFCPLLRDEENGVALELLLHSVPGLEVKDSPSRHLTWRARPDSDTRSLLHYEGSRSSAERDRPRTAPVLEPMLALFERELIDLLRSAPRCTIPFSKLIPAFHHHFGRQCRVADYGFTKLPDLLAALSNAVVVLGSGSYRKITISAAAQSRRWTSDLMKLLKTQPGRSLLPSDIPNLYQVTFGRAFSCVDYGVCTLAELMSLVTPGAVLVEPNGAVSLPRRAPSPEEQARTHNFAMEAVELLCYTPNLRMEFSRFVPAYHAHFGRQLRVAHYGCVKLAELFELIPGAVTVGAETSGERSVRLASPNAIKVMSQRLKSLAPVPLAQLAREYSARFGAAPAPEAWGFASLEALVFACGGAVHAGVVCAGAAPLWATGALAACAVLATDRSVARGSTQEYFVSAYRRLTGAEPEIRNLSAGGVLETLGERVQLSRAWRSVWRAASVLVERPRLSATELLADYTRRYEPPFTLNMDLKGMVELLRGYPLVFAEAGAEAGPDTRWSLCAGVSVPRVRETSLADYSVHDTPPGQKGSRVFDSPHTNLWCSPPASALPTPTALLAHDNRRRVRLAAQFDIA